MQQQKNYARALQHKSPHSHIDRQQSEKFSVYGKCFEIFGVQWTELRRRRRFSSRKRLLLCACLFCMFSLREHGLCLCSISLIHSCYAQDVLCRSLRAKIDIVSHRTFLMLQNFLLGLKPNTRDVTLKRVH